VKKLAQSICSVLSDYHNHHQFQFTPEHVLEWVTQFDEADRQFLLEEFLHLLNQGIYISEEMGRELLLSRIKTLARKFDSVPEFLKHVEFLSLQEAGKSQSNLLAILDELLSNNYGISLAHCGSKSKKFAIYIDDILATGNSAKKYLAKWLVLKNSSGRTNLEDVVSGNKFLIISVFCRHTWPDVGWRLKKDLNANGIENKIIYRSDYLIENHPTIPNQKLNFAYPVNDQTKEVMQYLQKLPEGYQWPMTKLEYALRDANRPKPDTLFSSPANRMRFENILLLKGIEILAGVKDLNHNQRPLGNINPSFQTLGSGTLFFTWMNVSNTTPIVFWWKVNWQYLFPVVNRGL
jgi:hypothetical protein